MRHPIAVSLLSCVLFASVAEAQRPTPPATLADRLAPLLRQEHADAAPEVLYVELDLTFNSEPTPGSHSLLLGLPAGVEAADYDSFLLVQDGLNPCVPTCSPLDQDISTFVIGGTFNADSAFTYSFDASLLGLEAAFFAVVVPKATPAPGQPWVVGYTGIGGVTFTAAPVDGYPVAFVTQVPMANPFRGVTEPFANHASDQSFAPKGGDLWIRYPDGTTRNLTEAAGYGNDGFQGLNAIAVRDPFVHWDAQKILFSMAHKGQIEFCSGDDCPRKPWQLFEISNFGQGQTPVITKVPGQPEDYNNTGPVYTANDKIIFMSDFIRDGYEHLYPYLDEYELEPTNSGVFRLDPVSGELRHLDDTPSGANWTTVDSYGRILYTRWDHLNRDQQNNSPTAGFQPVNFPNEEATDFAVAIPGYDQDVFPEAAATTAWDFDLNSYWNVVHKFEKFLPWMMNPDGTEIETINHVGRHELIGYFSLSSGLFGGLQAHLGNDLPSGMKAIDNIFQLSEDPTAPGWFLAINGPESRNHASGQIMRLYAPPGLSPTQMQIRWVTHPVTAALDETPGPEHVGFFRNPVRLSTGELLAAWSPTTTIEANLGTQSHPISKYDWRLVVVDESGQFGVPGPFYTDEISKSVSQHRQANGFVSSLMFHDGPLWQLSPVEVRPRPRPPLLGSQLATPEQQVFASVGVDEAEFRAWMKERNLALIVSRDVTTRDGDDLQQVYNLRVRGTNTQTIGSSANLWEVDYLQIFQGDRTRGYGTELGRRVHAVPLHDPEAVANNLPSAGPAGSVPIGEDGSQAAFVPAGRALSWQLTNSDLPIVRERFWLSFQAGEIRTCTSCHAINDTDQAGNPPPENQPEQLRQLLLQWKSTQN